MSNLRLRSFLIYTAIIMGVTILIMYIVHGEGHNQVTKWMTGSRRVRMTFGFSHPNEAALYYYGFIVCIMILLFFSKLRKIYPVIPILLLPLILYIYNKTQTRSFLIGIVILYMTYYYYNFRLLLNNEYRIKYSGYFFRWSFLFLTIATLVLPFFKSHLKLLDKVLSYRLSFFYDLYQRAGLKGFFFGTDAFDQKRVIVDSSFVRIIFEGGVWFALLFLFIYWKASKHIVKANHYFIIAVVLSFLAYGTMESILVYNMIISNNLIWMILAFYYFGQNYNSISITKNENKNTG